MTPQELESMRHFASIEPYTTEQNRAYHIAMCKAGWIPACDLLGIREWGNYSAAVLFGYDEAMEFYNEHGQAPTPF